MKRFLILEQLGLVCGRPDDEHWLGKPEVHGQWGLLHDHHVTYCDPDICGRRSACRPSRVINQTRLADV